MNGFLIPNPTSSYQQRVSEKRETIKCFKAEEDKKRSGIEKIADYLTNLFGSIYFLVFNIIVFITWIIINIGMVTIVGPFDPFPFLLLSMSVSAEAIFLSIFVLISQNRESKIADLREEIDLHVNTVAEEEITKMMKILTLLAKKQGIDLEKDEELKKMLEPLNTSQIEKNLEKEI